MNMDMNISKLTIDIIRWKLKLGVTMMDTEHRPGV